MPEAPEAEPRLTGPPSRSESFHREFVWLFVIPPILPPDKARCRWVTVNGMPKTGNTEGIADSRLSPGQRTPIKYRQRHGNVERAWRIHGIWSDTNVGGDCLSQIDRVRE